MPRTRDLHGDGSAVVCGLRLVSRRRARARPPLPLRLDGRGVAAAAARRTRTRRRARRAPVKALSSFASRGRTRGDVGASGEPARRRFW